MAFCVWAFAPAAGERLASGSAMSCPSLLALYRGATGSPAGYPTGRPDLSGGWSYLLGLLGWLVSLWLLFALWRALKAVFLRAELPAKTRAAEKWLFAIFFCSS